MLPAHRHHVLVDVVCACSYQGCFLLPVPAAAWQQVLQCGCHEVMQNWLCGGLHGCVGVAQALVRVTTAGGCACLVAIALCRFPAFTMEQQTALSQAAYEIEDMMSHIRSVGGMALAACE
jgi:hypothetical protein